MPGPRPRLTAQELLSRYEIGKERNFRGVDLSGQKLRGADLSEIDISDSDLRSTDLREANLTCANLSGCSLGRTLRWMLFHILLGLTIGSLLCLLGLYVYRLDNSNGSLFLGLVQVIAMPSLFLIYAFSFFPIRIIISLLISSIPSFFVLIIAFEESRRTIFLASIADAALLFPIWFIWKITTRKSGKDQSLWKGQSARYSRLGATNLMHANLTDTNFSQARLWGANFQGARLMRTKFVGAIDLDGAWFGWNAELRHPDIEMLARTLDGSGKNFGDKYLSGISLAGANLKKARLHRCLLVGADLTGAQLDDAEVVCAYIDGQTVERSGWTPDELLTLHERGVSIVGLNEFPEEVRTKLLGAHEGLTLYFNTRLMTWDRYLVDGVIFGVLGKDTDCQVAEFRNLKDRDAAVVRLVARRRQDLEQVAEALYQRAWEQEQKQQTALFGLANMTYGPAIREGLSALMGQRLGRMELREPARAPAGPKAVQAETFLNRAQLRWALALEPDGERFCGVRPCRLLLHHAPEDQTHVVELRKHLILLQQQGLVATDAEMLPGAELAVEFQARIHEADIVLALLSADYFVSAFCQTQLRQALIRRPADGLHIVPVLLRPVNWQDSLLAGLSPLPENGQPVATAPDRDSAWQAVVNGLRRLLIARL